MRYSHPISRRECLRKLGQGSVALGLLSALPPGFAEAEFADRSLRELAARKGLLYGSEAMKSQFVLDRRFTNNFKRECAVLVPGNELKWHYLRRNKCFDFGPADWLVKFACDRGLLVRGHTLIWGDSNPPWVDEILTSSNGEEYLRQHVAAVVERYAGRIYSWDVVNEPVKVWDGRSDGLSDSVWLKALGPDYIPLAFETAAQADPKAELVLNQNYLEYDSPRFHGFRTKTLQLLERLLSKNVPIHGLGIQGHLRSDHGSFNPGSFRKFLREVAGMGLKILITELDVLDAEMPADPGVRDRMVARQYEEFLEVALDEPAVTTVITWGLVDKYSWYVDFGARKDGAAVRPLPLDDSYRKKFAWHAIARALDATFQRGSRQ